MNTTYQFFHDWARKLIPFLKSNLRINEMIRYYTWYGSSFAARVLMPRVQLV